MLIPKSDDATPNANTAAPAVITVSRIGDERRRGMLPRSLKGMIKRRRLQPCRGIVLTPCGKEQFDTEKRQLSEMYLKSEIRQAVWTGVGE